MGLADHKTVSVFDVKSVIFLNEQPFIGLYRIFKYIPKKIFTFDHKKYNEDTRNYFENQNYAKQSVPIPSLQTSEQVQVPDSEQPTPMISDQADSLNQHNKNFFGPAIKLNPVRNGMEEFSYYSVFERVRPSRNYKLLETLKEERKKLVTNYETAIGLIRLAFSSELDVAIDRAKTYGFLPPPMLDSLILSDPQSLIDYLSAKIAKPKRPIDLSTFGSSHYIEQLDERKGLLQNYLENDKLQLSEQIPASVRVRTISEMEEEIKVFMELCDDKADEIKQSYRTEINPTDLEDRIYKSIYRGKIPTITGSYSFTEVPNNARHEGEYGEGYRALNVTRENMLKDLIDSLKVAEKSEFISECIIKQIEQDIDNNELCELSSKKELVKAKKAQDEAFKQCTNVCKEVKELFNGVPDNILEQRLDELIQQYKNITDDDKNILNELIKVKDHLNQLKLASQNFEKLASENNFTEYLQRTIEKGPLRCYLAQAWAYTKPLNLFIWGHESDSDLPQEISLLFEDSPYDSKIKEQVDILYSVSKVKVSDKESSLVHKFVRLKRI